MKEESRQVSLSFRWLYTKHTYQYFIPFMTLNTTLRTINSVIWFGYDTFKQTKYHSWNLIFHACVTARQTDMTFPSPSFLTWVSSCVHRGTKQQQVLCDRGMEEAHGAHPTSGVHKHPLQVLIWQDVARIPKFSYTLLAGFLRHMTSNHTRKVTDWLWNSMGDCCEGHDGHCLLLKKE